MKAKILELMEITFNVDLTDKDPGDCSPESMPEWDSVSFLNLVAILEEEYRLSFTISEIGEMAAGGAAVYEVVKRKAGGGD